MKFALLLACVLSAPISTFNNWMALSSAQIGSRHLYEIDIPGAHHAGFVSVPWYDAVAGIWSKCQSD
ncbi:hypothetical protein HDU91_005966, partial [Kappamyces sp. JEL0680]